MKRILLTQGKHTLVSDCDYGYLSQWKWRFDRYAVRTVHVRGNSKKTKVVFMHLVIAKRMRMSLKSEVDHKNQDKLDNQRHNLRPANDRQQNGNRGLRKDNTSGYRGVTWKPKSRKWQAEIHLGKKKVYLGLHLSKRKAATAWNRAATKAFGKYAWLNPV